MIQLKDEDCYENIATGALVYVVAFIVTIAFTFTYNWKIALGIVIIQYAILEGTYWLVDPPKGVWNNETQCQKTLWHKLYSSAAGIIGILIVIFYAPYFILFKSNTYKFAETKKVKNRKK